MQIIRFLLCAVAAFALAAFGTAPAGADTVYSDYASWSAQFPGATEVIIPQPVNTGYDSFGYGNASVTYSGVTFSSSTLYGNTYLYNIGTAFSNAPPVVSDQYANLYGGVENILITLPSQAQGIAVDYSTFNGSSVTFTLSDGYSYTPSAPTSSGQNYNLVAFNGAGAASITSVLVTSSDSVLNVGNVYYATTAVPEPIGIVSLVGLGGMGLVGGMWRRRRATA